MIWFFNLEKASAVSCDDYDDLFQYINELGIPSPSKVYPKFAQTCEHLDSSSEDGRMLKKQWCLEYCKGHNYIVIENSVPANSSPKPSITSQSYSDNYSQQDFDNKPSQLASK